MVQKQVIRNWTLYVVRFNDQSYYVGITSYKDFMRRINQHGGRKGARLNKGKSVQEIIEVQHLGKLSNRQAENIENDVFLEYRKRYGRVKSGGGYNISKQKSFIPTYTPGSYQAYLYIISGLLLGLLLLLVITAR